MELFRNNKNYIYIGITGLFTSLIYFLWRRNQRNRLPKKFVDRLSVVRAKYEEASKKFTEEVIYTIMNIVQDIADFFYYRDYSFEEGLRSDCLNDHPEEYEHFCFETMQYQHECMEKAKTYVNSNTGINFKDVNDWITKYPENYRDLMIKYRTRNEGVPEVEKNKAKEAYLFYANAMEKNSRLSAIMGSSPDPHQQQELMKRLIVNQFQVKDTLLEKFNIDERYLLDLLDIHNLREDNDVKSMINRLKQLDEMKMASKLQRQATAMGRGEELEH